MKTIKTTLFSAALIAVVATPAFAADGKKTKEIKELVGYNVTETTTYQGPKAEDYAKMDVNGDNSVTFKEYRNYSNLDNEYDAFIRMDKDGNKNLSLEEFVNANLIKGDTQVESELFGKAVVKGTNLKTRALPETKTYFTPVEPTIVEVKDIEPAAE
ncbi:MAG: hypothetical protein R3D88_05030 [Alphaproteobacteria bacterium]|nr:hypothetical protein [Alphaproteobacteria bacterium]